MDVREASDAQAWDDFLGRQRYCPFLQSWTMGEVYRDLGQDPVRLEVRDGGKIVTICQGIIVPARRGRHLAVPYGPVTSIERRADSVPLLEELQKVAKDSECSFIRISPFWPEADGDSPIQGSLPSPMHMLAEHLWITDLRGASEDALFSGMRKTTRNLVRRAERDGVTVEASSNPVSDLPLFLALHEETRRRHGFTPYSDAFFRAQIRRFAPRNECTLYLAHFGNNVIASSIHMHAFGETSYHHGASSAAHAKIPASYLLQWTAIRDALRRGDHLYNFWGIAPPLSGGVPKNHMPNPRHPFAGVTTFKTGFRGELLELQHCMDLPIRSRYYMTRAFETFRKWRRGF